MENANNIKSKLLQVLLQQIDTQIETLNNAIASIHESKGNETKSSAGDKFETGRAMLHLEQDKLESQLSNAFGLKKKLNSLKSIAISGKIGVGSLIYTSKGIYFISIGIGKVLMDDSTYLVISTDSPIGKLLIGKSIGDFISFNGNEIEILDIG